MTVAMPQSSVMATRASPPMTIGGNAAAVPTVLGGLDEVLYRDAEERRWRQQSREEEVLERERQMRIPRLGRASRALCQGRLERELREAFEACGCSGQDLAVRRVQLPKVLEAVGLLCRGAEECEEDTFCAKLFLLLDRDNRGVVGFDSLLNFLIRAEAFVRDAPQDQRPRNARPQDLSEVCFAHLEQQLSATVGRLLTNRLSRPRVAPSPGSVVLSSAMDGASDSGGPWVGRSGAASSGSGARRRASSTSSAGSRASASGPHGTPAKGPRPQSARRGRGTTGEGNALSRCHLLYHQAVFASRESTQLCEEIKSLREREEMRECTFKPKLYSARRPPSPAANTQPRNFEMAVARMRRAQNQRLAKQEAVERIPRGENYERLRRLGTEPFSLYYKAQERLTSKRGPALLYVDVNVGHGRTGRIGVHEGDDLRVLARNFARAFQLDAELQDKLEEMLFQACHARWRRDFPDDAEDVEESTEHNAVELPGEEAPSVLELPAGQGPSDGRERIAPVASGGTAGLCRSWMELLQQDESVAAAVAAAQEQIAAAEAGRRLHHCGVDDGNVCPPEPE